MVAVFDSRMAAEKARQALLSQGISAEVGQGLAPDTTDDIAAEAPGQSYQNQPGQGPEGSERSAASALDSLLGTTQPKQRRQYEYEEAVLSGAGALTVEVPAGAEERITKLMKEHGVRRTAWRAEE